MALGIVGMLGLGTYVANMTVSLDNLWLFGLHKSIGVTLLAVGLLRMLWHRISPPPHPIGDQEDGWQLVLARWAHRSFYGLLICVPLTGWIASGATGLDVIIYNSVILPPLAPVSSAWEQSFFAAHRILTKLLLILLALHVAGALNRHFVKRDRTLIRMLRG